MGRKSKNEISHSIFALLAYFQMLLFLMIQYNFSPTSRVFSFQSKLYERFNNSSRSGDDSHNSRKFNYAASFR